MGTLLYIPTSLIVPTQTYLCSGKVKHARTLFATGAIIPPLILKPIAEFDVCFYAILDGHSRHLLYDEKKMLCFSYIAMHDKDFMSPLQFQDKSYVINSDRFIKDSFKNAYDSVLNARKKGIHKIQDLAGKMCDVPPHIEAEFL